MIFPFLFNNSLIQIYTFHNINIEDYFPPTLLTTLQILVQRTHSICWKLLFIFFNQWINSIFSPQIRWSTLTSLVFWGNVRNPLLFLKFTLTPCSFNFFHIANLDSRHYIEVILDENLIWKTCTLTSFVMDINDLKESFVNINQNLKGVDFHL